MLLGAFCCRNVGELQHCNASALRLLALESVLGHISSHQGFVEKGAGGVNRDTWGK